MGDIAQVFKTAQLWARLWEVEKEVVFSSGIVGMDPLWVLALERRQEADRDGPGGRHYYGFLGSRMTPILSTGNMTRLEWEETTEADYLKLQVSCLETVRRLINISGLADELSLASRAEIIHHDIQVATKVLELKVIGNG